MRRLCWFALSAALAAQDPDLQSRIIELHTPGKVQVEQPRSSPLLPSGPPLDLPQDDGQHPESAAERWVLRGTLQSPVSGRRYGLQVLIARRNGTSAWRGNAAWRSDRWWVAQAVLVPPEARRITWAERLGREGLPASGAQDRLDLHVEGWRLLQERDILRLHVRLAEGPVDLELAPRALQISLPSIEGRPLHRAFLPLLDARGELNLQGQLPLAVRGRFSLMHEWGEIPPSVWVGWDQAVLHFSDGRAWILDGGRTAGKDLGSSCQLAEVDGRGRLTRLIKNPPISFRKAWTSAASAARYPISLQIQAWKELVRLEPALENQEVRPGRPGASTLYRGFCALRNRRGEGIGDAFLELAGYAHPMNGGF